MPGLLSNWPKKTKNTEVNVHYFSSTERNKIFKHGKTLRYNRPEGILNCLGSVKLFIFFNLQEFTITEQKLSVIWHEMYLLTPAYDKSVEMDNSRTREYREKATDRDLHITTSNIMKVAEVLAACAYLM